MFFYVYFKFVKKSEERHYTKNVSTSVVHTLKERNSKQLYSEKDYIKFVLINFVLKSTDIF